MTNPAQASPEPARQKYRLITNLSYVLVNGVRTMTHALLLSDDPGQPDRGPFFAPRKQLRGFGPDAAWPVFDLDVRSLEYTSENARSGDVFVMGEGEPKPLFTGEVLVFAGGPTVLLLAQDDSKPIEIQNFEGAADEQPILRVWNVLTEQVAKYWHAPNMPGLVWGPPRRIVEMARASRW